jgi:hypothetical protein
MSQVLILAGVKFVCLAFFDLAGAGAYGHGPPRGKTLLQFIENFAWPANPTGWAGIWQFKP